MKLTKKEFELLVKAVKMLPSSICLGGFMRAMLSKGTPMMKPRKKYKKHYKRRVNLLLASCINWNQRLLSNETDYRQPTAI